MWSNTTKFSSIKGRVINTSTVATSAATITASPYAIALHSRHRQGKDDTNIRAATARQCHCHGCCCRHDPKRNVVGIVDCLSAQFQDQASIIAFDAIQSCKTNGQVLALNVDAFSHCKNNIAAAEVTVSTTSRLLPAGITRGARGEIMGLLDESSAVNAVKVILTLSVSEVSRPPKHTSEAVDYQCLKNVIKLKRVGDDRHTLQSTCTSKNCQ
jgi:hypothetical protein